MCARVFVRAHTPQFVRNGADVNESETRSTNTGVLQGTALSPFLTSVYTADCRTQHENAPIVKFADGTGLTGLVSDDED